jgi:ElaB/YqjD/DUF883 family membrane-anchored ribosome-binding protein
MATAKRRAGNDGEPAVARARSSRPARDGLYQQARGMTDDLQEMGGLAKDAAQEELGKVGEMASACYAQGRDQVRRVERGVQHFIREQPLTSVLIAAGAGAIGGAVGVLLGRLWMRR